MTGTELINRYVADVVKLLPRRQRHDVATELRQLLTEEQQDSSADDTRELLRRFGHPTEVAARYGQPVTLIDPADTRRFLTLAVGGAAVAHLGSYLDELIKPTGDVGRAADEAWPVVFQWLGLLFVGFAVLAWWRRRRTEPAEWKPSPVPSDRINRTGRIAGVVFFTVSTLVLAAPATAIRFVTQGRAAPAAYDAFAYDEDFLRVRGPILLALMVSGIALQAGIAWAGRWRPGLRTADLVHSVVVCGALTWAIGTGPIFTAAPTDQAVKGACALIVLGSLIDLAVRARRLSVASALSSHD